MFQDFYQNLSFYSSQNLPLFSFRYQHAAKILIIIRPHML